MQAPYETPLPPSRVATPGALTRYTRFELIGQGVSAKVYRALDTVTNSLVAVKVLNPHLRTDEISLERFRREAQITRYLNHPQVISVFDLVQGESLALVMEYVPGSNLKDYLKLHAPLEPAQAIAFLTQILKVLAVCHRKNVIHRDLKPQNIIVGPDQYLKLLDFGIARMTSLTDLTQTGTSLGSPEYMAPELFAASVFDPRTDLYAIGVMAYEMLTGELPFQGDSVPVLFHQHVNAPAPRVSAQRDGVPAWLDDLIAKLLAKQAYERYQSADQTLADIANERVISKSFPTVRRRDCLRCSRPTLADLSICTFCGYDRVNTFDEGEYEVQIPPNEDRGRLESFLKGVFRFKKDVPKRPDLLMTRVDRLSAELVKTSAFAHGLFLTVKKRVPHADALRIGSTCLVLYFALLLLNLVPGLYALLDNRRFDSVGPLVTAIVLPVLGAWASFRLFLWTHRKPLFDAEWQSLLHEGKVAVVLEVARSSLAYILIALFGFSVWGGLLVTWAALAVALVWAQGHPDLGPLVYGRRPRGPRPEAGSLPEGLRAEHDWLKEIVPLGAAIRTEDQQISVSRLIEKYYLLRERVPDLDGELRQRLKILIKSAAQVAGLVSELESTVTEATLAEWSREYLTSSVRAAEGPTEHRPEHRRRASLAAARLRSYYDLDFKKAPLYARLIHLQYAFDTLLGRALVFHAVLGEVETRFLEGSIAALERDVTVCREIRQELAELT